METSTQSNHLSDILGNKELVTDAQPETKNETPMTLDIVINNVVCSFNLRCHLDLRRIALNGTNVEYRRENGVSNARASFSRYNVSYSINIVRVLSLITI